MAVRSGFPVDPKKKLAHFLLCLHAMGSGSGHPWSPLTRVTSTSVIPRWNLHGTS